MRCSRSSTALSRTIKIGDPLDPSTAMGPLTSRHHRDRVLSFVDVAREQGGRVLAGGKAPDAAALAIEEAALTQVREQLPGVMTSACDIADRGSGKGHAVEDPAASSVRDHRADTRERRTGSARRDSRQATICSRAGSMACRISRPGSTPAWSISGSVQSDLTMRLTERIRCARPRRR